MLSKKQLLLVLVVLFAYYWMKYVKNGTMYETDKRIDGKTVLITGGNAGVGRGSAMEFAKLGAKVIIASRNVKKSLKAVEDIIKESGNKNVYSMHLDLEHFESIQSFAEEFNEKEEHLHYLINNAGVIGLKGMTDYGYQRVFAINHFGTFLLTNLLVEKMKKQSQTNPVRIITVSSAGYKFGPFDFERIQKDSKGFFDDYRMYGQSKLANIYFTKELAKRLKGFDITTYAVHPGAVKSEIGLNPEMEYWRHIFHHVVSFLVLREEYYGAQTILYCALDDNVTSMNGEYFAEVANEELLDFAKNETVQLKLWQRSVTVTKKYLKNVL